MKIKSLMIVSLLCTGAEIFAQDTYSNFTMTNTSDVIGTARYVSMGGAMGALGADISAISNNPASIGLFKHYNMSVTMGGIIQEATPASCDNRSKYSFDQIGFVMVFQDENLGGVNFGMNFQKKMDATYSLATQYGNMGGLSQAALFSGLTKNILCSDASLPVCAYDATLFNIGPNETTVLYADPSHKKTIDENIYSRTYENDFWKYSTGEVYGLDFNLSGNVQNRIFWGFTLGIDFLRYKYDSRYIEYRNGLTPKYLPSEYAVQDYDLVANKYVSGSGLNIKIGAIFRPIEDNPFRIGLTVETPTWYTLAQKGSYYSIASKWYYDGMFPANGNVPAKDIYTYQPTSGTYIIYNSIDENYVPFNLYTPWRFRVALGTTVDTKFAFDVEYEYAMNNYMKMGKPVSYNYSGTASLSMHTDVAMSALTKQTLKGIHNLRAGIEFKPVKSFAIRAGYNYFSTAMNKNARFDMSINSDYINFAVGTDFMNYGDTHIASVGLGYRGKKFFADIAYKCRIQHADFYAFDDMYQTYYQPEAQFCYSGGSLQATDVDLTRHTIAVTIGANF